MAFRTAEPDSEARGSGLDKVVFGVTALIAVGFLIWGLVSTATLSSASGKGLAWTMTDTGWVFVLTASAFVVFVIWLAMGRFGTIPLGPPGTGAEGSAQTAMATTLFHWTLHPCAIYAVVGGIGVAGNRVLVGIIAVLTIAFVLSAVSGAAMGIQWLSNVNMVPALALAAFVCVLGPTVSILNLLPTALGSYAGQLPEMAARTGAEPGAPGLVRVLRRHRHQAPAGGRRHRWCRRHRVAAVHRARPVPRSRPCPASW